MIWGRLYCEATLNAIDDQRLVKPDAPARIVLGDETKEALRVSGLPWQSSRQALIARLGRDEIRQSHIEIARAHVAHHDQYGRGYRQAGACVNRCKSVWIDQLQAIR